MSPTGLEVSDGKPATLRANSVGLEHLFVHLVALEERRGPVLLPPICVQGKLFPLAGTVVLAGRVERHLQLQLWMGQMPYN